MVRKAQAAMEFLMTYGWALLVVLIAIGALAFFGVLNPSKFLPNSCSLAPGFSCTDFKASEGSNNVVVLVQNGLGENLNTVSLRLSDATGIKTGGCSGATGTTGAAFGPTGITLNDGASTQFTLGCTVGDLTKGTKLKGNLQLDYTIASSLIPHKKIGQLVLGVEA